MWLPRCHVKELRTLKTSHPFEALELSSEGFLKNGQRNQNFKVLSKVAKACVV